MIWLFFWIPLFFVGALGLASPWAVDRFRRHRLLRERIAEDVSIRTPPADAPRPPKARAESTGPRFRGWNNRRPYRYRSQPASHTDGSPSKMDSRESGNPSTLRA